MVRFLLVGAFALLNYASIAQIEASKSEGCVPFNVTFSTSGTDVKSYEWTFGNGQSSTIANPTIAFTEEGEYSVTLSVTYNDNSTENFELTNPIKAGGIPEIDFTLNDQKVCVNSEISIINNTKGAISYLWDFGDGNIGDNPVHQYSTPGKYDITLIATSSSGCQSVVVQQDVIEVVGIQEIGSEISTTEVCVNQGVSFTVSDFETYLWDFGDSNSSDDQSPIHSYSEPGEYSVVLTVSDVNGCLKTELINKIMVYDLPKTDLHFDEVNVCTLSTFTLTEQPLPFDSVIWDFGDEYIFTGASPILAFDGPGVYGLTIKVYNETGCSEEKTFPELVTVSEAAFLDVSLENDFGCVPFEVNAINRTEQISKTSWLINDQRIEGAELNEEITEPGDYILSVISEFASGCLREDIIDTLYVREQPLNIISSVDNGCAPQNINFSLDGDVESALWEFSDGQTSMDLAPDIIFDEPGDITVKCSVINEFGCEVEVSSERIQIYRDGIDFRNPDPIVTCRAAEVYFDGSLGAESWLWDFGDGNTSTDMNPTHHYSHAGEYVVRLTTKNQFGCEATIENYNTIIVSEITASYDAEIIDIGECPFFTVRFTSEVPNATDYYWEFDDGQVFTEANPTVTFRFNGQIKTKFAVWDEYGCSNLSAGLVTSPWPACESDSVPPMQGGDLPPSVFRFMNELRLCSAPSMVNFTNPRPEAASWLWDFGDGHTSTEYNPEHVFATMDSFFVSLYSTYDDGTIDSLYEFTQVTIAQPDVDFEYDKQFVCEGTEVSFAAKGNELTTVAWDFGDGKASESPSPINLYSESDMYQVTLTAKDTAMCGAKAIKNIMIGNPYESITYDHQLCLGETFTVNHNLTGFETLRWKLGDGSEVEGTDLEYTYKETGTYTVEVVGRSGECEELFILDKKVIVVNPQANFEASATHGCNELEVSFYNLSVDSDRYTWVLNDHDTMTVSSPSVTLGPGKYSVQLISDKYGCKAQMIKEDYITVDELVADFDYHMSSECLPVTIAFENKSIGAETYFWDFGDGNTSTDKHPTHTFNEPPSKPIYLKSTNANGCKVSIQKNVQVINADFEADKSSICLGEEIRFESKYKDGSGYFWDFGDGSTSSEQSPKHTYTGGGTYTISLEVSGSDGCSLKSEKVDFVEVQVVKAGFEATLPESTCAPVIIEFVNNSEGAEFFNWDFGDHSSSSAASPVHVYQNTGSFPVSLIAANKLGCLDTLKMNDLVTATGPRSAIEISAMKVCHPSAIDIRDTSKMAVKWEWLLGDGNIIKDSSFSYGYEESGIYSINLTSWDADGCQQTLQMDSIVVLPQPKADFDLVTYDTCLPVDVNIANESTDLFNPSFEWLVNGEGITSERDFNHSFTESGEFNIALVVANDNTCYDTLIGQESIMVYDTVQVAEPYVNDFSVVDDKMVRLSHEGVNTNNFKFNLIYRSLRDTDTYEICDTLWNDATFNDMEAFPDQYSYNYKIQTHSYCADTVSRDLLNNYKSIRVDKVRDGDSIRIRWNEYEGHSFDSYMVMRKEKDHWVEVSQLAPGNQFYEENQELCPGEHTYQIRATNLDGSGSHSASNEIEVTLTNDVFSNQKVTIVRTTVVDNNQVFNEWLEPKLGYGQIEYYEIWRGVESDFELIDRVPRGVTSYYDQFADVNTESYDYKIKVINTCNIETAISNLSNSILLQKESDYYKNRLFWRSYEGWDSGVGKYLIQEQDEFGQWVTVREIDSLTNEVIIDLQND